MTRRFVLALIATALLAASVLAQPAAPGRDTTLRSPPSSGWAAT